MNRAKLISLTLAALVIATSQELRAQSQDTDYEQTVTPKSPVDFTSRIQYPDFEQGLTGWVNEAGFVTFERASWNGVKDGKCISGTYYLNLYHSSGLKGRVVQTVKDVPNGVYAVKAGVFTNTPGANIFAGDNIVPAVVNATQFYTAYALVEDSTLKLGYYSTHEKDFWSVVDNFSLTYYGNGDDARQLYQEVSGAQEAEALAKIYGRLMEAVDIAEALLDDLGGKYFDDLAAEVRMAREMFERQQATALEIEAQIARLNELISTGRQFKEAHDQLGKLLGELREGIAKYKDTGSPRRLARAAQLLEDMQDAYYYIDLTTTEEMNSLATRCKNMLEQLPLPDFIDDDEKAEDCTRLITNPGFENGSNGWVNDPIFDDCKPTNWATMIDGTYMTGSYYMNLFCPANYHAGSLHQTITRLPPGKYHVGASVFSNRAGLVFFANDHEVAIPIGPSSAPYGRFFGIYLTVAEGETLTFGVRTNEAVEFWGAVDDFTLTRYVKDTTGILPLQADAGKEDIYTLTGARKDSVGKGISILRTSDGRTRKVFTK
jgi:hypothetical protein